ncbi:MAG: BLUF domain-containing protein [Leptospiraceae bacterium]|nr:BLUF domain-containing protein [Leptospiraceae bacterium]MCP5495553.1 BLUF domain-containing protein [Leptospiraceae bacterium]
MYLIRLIYASKVNNQINPKIIQDILDSSRRNNPKKGLTGILCFNKDNFLQCLEGSRKSVNEVFTTIAKDKRHAEIVILDYNEIYERSFERWAMGYAGETELNKSIMLKYSGKDYFDPFSMSGESTYKFLLSLSKTLTT